MNIRNSAFWKFCNLIKPGAIALALSLFAVPSIFAPLVIASSLIPPLSIASSCLVSARNAMEVVVQKFPAQIEKKVFDPKHLPEPNPLQPGEDATTQWSYDYTVVLEPDIREKKESEGKVSVLVRYKKATIKLTLPITIWLPNNSDKKLEEHEDGHRQICEEIYKECDVTVRNHVQVIAGQSFIGTGKTLKEALDDAERKAGAQLNSYYRHAAMDYSKHVSDIYDELTAHGGNKRPVFLAVQEALLRGFFNRHMNKPY